MLSSELWRFKVFGLQRVGLSGLRVRFRVCRACGLRVFLSELRGFSKARSGFRNVDCLGSAAFWALGASSSGGVPEQPTKLNPKP